MAETIKAYDANEVRFRLRRVVDEKYRGSTDRLAVKLGVSGTYVSMVLRGERKPPPWALKLTGMELVAVYREKP